MFLWKKFELCQHFIFLCLKPTLYYYCYSNTDIFLDYEIINVYVKTYSILFSTSRRSNQTLNTWRWMCRSIHWWSILENIEITNLIHLLIPVKHWYIIINIVSMEQLIITFQCFQFPLAPWMFSVWVRLVTFNPQISISAY